MMIVSERTDVTEEPSSRASMPTNKKVDRAVDVVARLAVRRGRVALEQRALGDRALRTGDHGLRGDQRAAAQHHENRTEDEDETRP